MERRDPAQGAVLRRWLESTVLPGFEGSPALCVEAPWGRDGGTIVQGLMTLLYSLPGCDIDRVIRDLDRLVIVARRRRDHGRCPSCGVRSSAVHSRTERRPDDLPSCGWPVRLRVQVRRFCCHRPDCPRRTFTEQLPKLLAPRARRTRRLARAQARIGLALGGEEGRATAAASRDAHQPRHGAPPGAAPAVAPGEGAPRGGHRRLGAPQGAELRHHRGRSGTAAAARSGSPDRSGSTLGPRGCAVTRASRS